MGTAVTLVSTGNLPYGKNEKIGYSSSEDKGAQVRVSIRYDMCKKYMFVISKKYIFVISKKYMFVVFNKFWSTLYM